MSKSRDLPANGLAPTKVRTLADLAALAGVHTGTVSRALADNPLVKERTRLRIQALAKEHGFRPNQLASRLRTQRTGVIGVVIPLGHDRQQHVSDPFFMEMLGNLADQLTETGYNLMLSRAIPSEQDDWLEDLTGSGLVDGVIVIGQSDQFAEIERVAQDYAPLVAWGNFERGQHHTVVGTDNFLGGKLAAQSLLDSGASNLAFFGDTKGIEIASRLEGARSVAPVTDYPIHLSIAPMQADIAKALDALDPECDAIIAASDLIAMATIRHLKERKISVPEQFQVVGFDDLPAASQSVPALTSIRQDIAGGAATMVELLKAKIAGNPAQSVVMSPEIMLRETTRQ